MKQFYSLSMFPGKTGEHYYNTLFKKFSLPYTYTALECTDIHEGVKKMRECNAAGFAVSMPFKNSVIKEIDFVWNVASRFNSVNTVELIKDKLYGYNADFFAAHHIITKLIPTQSKIAILGDGSMGSMFKQMLGDRAVVYSRKNGNWDDRYLADDVIINCTSFGTVTDESPFERLPKCNLVVDLAIKPNQLEEQAKTANVKYIGGIVFYKHQFIHQFAVFTKHQLTINDLEGI